MSNQIIEQTQQAYVLTLNVITIDNEQGYLQQIPLFSLTKLIATVWYLMLVFNQVIALKEVVIRDFLTMCEAFYLLVDACGKPLRKTLAVNYGGVL